MWFLPFLIHQWLDRLAALNLLCCLIKDSGNGVERVGIQITCPHTVHDRSGKVAHGAANRCMARMILLCAQLFEAL